MLLLDNNHIHYPNDGYYQLPTLGANPKWLQSPSFPSAHKGRAKSDSGRQGLEARGLDPRLSTWRPPFCFHAFVSKPGGCRFQALVDDESWNWLPEACQVEQPQIKSRREVGGPPAWLPPAASLQIMYGRGYIP